MSPLDELGEVIKAKTRIDPARWVEEWLLPNKLNKERILPMNAPFTMVTGLNLLFTIPYQAVCNMVHDLVGATIEPFVAISDTDPTWILIIDVAKGKVVRTYKHNAWEFRFDDLKGLKAWLIRLSKDLSKDLGGGLAP